MRQQTSYGIFFVMIGIMLLFIVPFALPMLLPVNPTATPVPTLSIQVQVPGYQLAVEASVETVYFGDDSLSYAAELNGFGTLPAIAYTDCVVPDSLVSTPPILLDYDFPPFNFDYVFISEDVISLIYIRVNYPTGVVRIPLYYIDSEDDDCLATIFFDVPEVVTAP